MKSSPEKQQQIKKIVVRSENELTDIVGTINETDNGRILLTFTESSDLLVSPIGLKVIQDVTDEQEKTLVMQIIGNPSGQRNATEAGIEYTESASSIDDDLWDRAEKAKAERSRDHATRLRSNNGSVQKSTRGYAPVVDAEIADNQTETPDEFGEEPQAIDKDENYEFENDSQLEQEPTPIREKSEYSKHVEQALQRSREVIEQGGIRVVKTGSLEIALDDDIAETQTDRRQSRNDEMEYVDNSSSDDEVEIKYPQGNSRANVALPHEKARIQGLSGRDLLAGAAMSTDNRESRLHIQSQKGDSPISKIVAGVKPIFAKISTNGKKLIKSKGLVYIIVPTIAVIILGLWLAYKLAPLARVEINITSTPVEIVEEFTGDPSTTTFSLDDRALRVKKESLENELSDGGTATGTASRGEKAGGSITIKCLKFSGTESIPGGTTLVANGKNYKTVSDIAVACPGVISTTIQAAEVGEEYNQPVGSIFVVGAYSTTEVVGINDSSAISGGSKEEYRVVSQADVDDVAKRLKEQAETSANSKLADFEKDGWVMIKSSVVHEADGKPVTDVPVGTESELFNVTAKYKSAALYFNQSDVEAEAEKLLLQKAEEQNLFEADEAISLKLNEKITKAVTVKNIADNKVTVELKVIGAVIPNVDKTKIITDLQGETWKDGKSYLKNLPYAVSEPKTSFIPTWIPEGMWYFPTRQGRIMVSIKQVSAPTVAE